MTGSLRHLSFRRLETSEVHLRYLEGDEDLTPYLGARPRDAKSLLATAPVEAARVLDREELGAALLAYAERHDASDASLEVARNFGSGKPTLMVVTGQQPGLLGGPLYTLHKVATAVRLARDLQALTTTHRVVPFFWNHTDDHDFDEVNRAFLVNGQQELQRLRLDIAHEGEAIRDVGVGHALDSLLGEVLGLVPETEFRDWAFDLIRPRTTTESLGAGMARMLFALFGDSGLQILEPRELPAPAFPVLEKWWRQGEKIRNSIRGTTEHLLALGLDVGFDPGATLMFHLAGKRRLPLSDGDELPRDVRDLSPGAILRPLWQDACLPTVAFVVGPGELSYLTLAGPLYRQLGVPRPHFVPRASLTVVEPSLNKLLAKFGWDIPDLAEGSEALVKRRLSGETASELEHELRLATQSVDARLGDVAGRARESDHPHEQQVATVLDRLRGKLVEDLVKLADRLQKSRADQQGTGARQIRRLCSWLRPRGRLQERVLATLPMLVLHGPAFGAKLVDAADPFGMDHGVLEP